MNTQKPYSNTAPIGQWIDIGEMKPPLIEETPETDGFFILERHNPKRDPAGRYRHDLWFGSVPIDSTRWCRIPSFYNK